MRRFLLIAALATVTGCGAKAAQSAEVPKSEIGRYQIVNGHPASVGFIMLLDTQTGRTWRVCTSSDTVADVAFGVRAYNWCPMDLRRVP